MGLPGGVRVTVTGGGDEALAYELSPAPPAGATSGQALDRVGYGHLLSAYLNERVVQIDELCAAYFSQLDGAAANATWAQDQLNVIGNFTSVIMGLTGSPAQHLAILAGAQAATNESFDAATTALLLSPEPSTVYQLVRMEQRSLLSSAPTTLGSFRQAESIVTAYANACVPNGIREIINRALTDQAREGDPDNLSASLQASLTLVRQVLNEGAPEGQAGLLSLSTDQAAHLLWLQALSEGSGDEAERAHVRRALGPEIVALVSAGDGAAITSALAQMVAASPAMQARMRELRTAYAAQFAAAQTASAAQTRIEALDRDVRARDQTILRLQDEVRRLSPVPPVVPEPVGEGEASDDAAGSSGG